MTSRVSIPTEHQGRPHRGFSITVTAGLAYVIFSPAFNLATNDQWHKLDQGVPHLVVCEWRLPSCWSMRLRVRDPAHRFDRPGQQ